MTAMPACAWESLATSRHPASILFAASEFSLKKACASVMHVASTLGSCIVSSPAFAEGQHAETGAIWKGLIAEMLCACAQM